jgi:hypothetical protein
MKKWRVILAIFLCVIAIGGLAVLFREDSDLKEKEPQNQEQEQPPNQEQENRQGGEEEKVEVVGIVLSHDYLIF